MKRSRATPGIRRLTPRQIVLAELKRERVEDCVAIEDFITNYLIPQLEATKMVPIFRNGKVVDLYEVDNRAQLRAMHIAFWLHGSYATKVPMPAELRGVRFPSVDASHPETPAASSPIAQTSGRKKRKLQNELG